MCRRLLRSISQADGTLKYLRNPSSLFSNLLEYLRNPSSLFSNDSENFQGGAKIPLQEGRSALEAFRNDKKIKILLLHAVGVEGGFV